MNGDDLRGIDYPWLAIDDDGHVGVFTSAGEGPIPRWVVDDHAWCDALLDIVAALPKRGTFRLEVPDLSTTPGLRHWKGWAQVGLFAYDWWDIHRPIVECSRRYEAIATPTVPVKADVMPAALRERPILAGVCFAKTRLLDVTPFV